jgi:hypothetical protein
MNMRHWSMKWLLMLMAATMVAAAQDLSFEGLLKDGVKSYNNGDYKTAAEKFEDAGKLRPDDARVKYNEALSRYMNKEYEAAENGFQTAKEKGYAEDDNFKAVCDLGIGNCHYERSMQIAKDVEGKQPQEAVKQLQEAKASCEKSIDSYRDALRYSQKLKNVQDNLKTARHQRKEIVKTLRKLEEELKQQPQQQQDDQKQDGKKQDGEQQQQDDQKQDGQKQDGEKQDGEQQQQNTEQQQQKDAGEQLEQLAKRQSEEAEKNEQGQQNQQQAADEQKKLSDETEQTRQAMEQQRKEAEKQDGQSSEKSEAEKKLEEAQDAQKKAEESLEKGDMKSASEAQKEAAEKLDEARKAMSEGEKKDEEEKQQDQQQQKQEQQQPQQEEGEEQMSETDNDIQNILDQERNNQRKRLKLLRVKPVERDW